jgi:hypothetical protein
MKPKHRMQCCPGIETITWPTALILPWQSEPKIQPYMVYDGNRFALAPSPRLTHLDDLVCTHYPTSNVPGDLFLRVLQAA